MTVLSALAAGNTSLSERAIGHLHRLLAEWQLLSDLAFSDCLLFVPVEHRSAFIVLGQVRPFPAQTLYQEDLVGTVFEAHDRPKVAQAFGERRIVREGDPEWRDGVPIREETIPVGFAGETIAVISAEQNLAAARTPSHLELAYLRAAGDLEQMISEGTFPFAGEEAGERELSPRVGDGFLHLDADLVLTYASPNAVSAYRRLGLTGPMVETRLGALGIDEHDVIDALFDGRPIDDEVEMHGAWVLRRFIPVMIGGAMHGAIGLVRDVTELRRRDRMLLIKDATIREIHHRVKNNLQTVASLLRLQARRLGTSAARAELEESVRRISSIALVHETLSRDSGEQVDFDEVAHRVLQMIERDLARPDRPVRVAVEGSAGELIGDVATPLSLVLSELVQNSLEHAFVARGGTVTVTLRRDEHRLRLVVRDDGAGLPEGFAIERGNLGLQIVRTLITEELKGSIELRSDAGTIVEIEIPLTR